MCPRESGIAELGLCSVRVAARVVFVHSIGWEQVTCAVEPELAKSSFAVCVCGCCGFHSCVRLLLVAFIAVGTSCATVASVVTSPLSLGFGFCH
jgi:hypothetical protein